MPTTAPSQTPQIVTLDAKIGQMLMVGFRGLSVSDDSPIAKDIRERNLGGVVFFDTDFQTQKAERNIQSPQQVKSLVAGLQKYAATPLLIAIDQEGGAVARLKEVYGFPASVSQESLGKKNNLDATRQAAEKTATTLAELGINLNLAPVVDLNINPDNPAIGKFGRSFSADPKIVTSHALEMIRTQHQHGVLTTLKHFPGHGSSKDDSHLGFVDVTGTWAKIELEPFANIIQAGEADAVMTAHIFNAKLDAKLPATLSKSIITGILRDNLKFNGVVISDDMQMKAISQYYGLETAIQYAIDAGVDILAIANQLEYDEAIVAKSISIIKNLMRDGKISETRIDQSYSRIMQLKRKIR